MGKHSLQVVLSRPTKTWMYLVRLFSTNSGKITAGTSVESITRSVPDAADDEDLEEQVGEDVDGRPAAR